MDYALPLPTENLSDKWTAVPRKGPSVSDRDFFVIHYEQGIDIYIYMYMLTEFLPSSKTHRFLWGGVGWGGVGWDGNVHSHFHTYVMLRYCPFFCTFHTYVMLRYCLFFCTFHTYVMLRWGWGGVGWGGMVTFIHTSTHT